MKYNIFMLALSSLTVLASQEAGKGTRKMTIENKTPNSFTLYFKNHRHCQTHLDLPENNAASIATTNEKIVISWNESHFNETIPVVDGETFIIGSALFFQKKRGGFPEYRKLRPGSSTSSED